MESADHALLRRWQQGDAAAFEMIVRRWEGPVARFVGRLLAADQLDDALQEVFLRVYRAGPSFRVGKAAFSTWLFQIALNVARDARRRAGRLPPARANDALEPLDAAEPWNAADTREIETAVAEALASLPEPLRVVLLLRHYEGLSFEEIGRICEAPASTVKSRFAAALARLRPRLRAFKPDVWETKP